MNETVSTSESTSISNEGSQTDSTGAEEVVATENTDVAQATTQTEAPATEANQQPAEQTQGAETGDSETAATDSETSDQESGDQKPSNEAPESYEFVSPEGQTLDPVVMDTFSATAKELGLSQENAQELVSTVGPKITAKLQEQAASLVAGWEKEAINDAFIGGSGDSEVLNKNLALANKSIDLFGDQELRTLLDETGFGSHPAILRMNIKLGKLVSEDSFVGSGNSGEGQNLANNGLKSEADMAKTLYPEQT